METLTNYIMILAFPKYKYENIPQKGESHGILRHIQRTTI